MKITYVPILLLAAVSSAINQESEDTNDVIVNFESQCPDGWGSTGASLRRGWCYEGCIKKEDYLDMDFEDTYKDIPQQAGTQCFIRQTYRGKCDGKGNCIPYVPLPENSDNDDSGYDDQDF